MRGLLSLIGLLGLALAGMNLAFVRAEDAASNALFNGKDLTGWKIFVDPKDKGKTPPEDIWKVVDGTIVCKGRPFGYIITEKDYGNYILELEWKWADKPGNSGVLLHVSGENKIWPKCFEAQLMANNAGDIWLIDDYKLTVDAQRQDKRIARHFFRMKTAEPVEKKVGEWNKYVITCKGDQVKLEINGMLVNEGTAAETTKGKIALQSEGAEIHFRNIKLTPIR